MTRLPFSRGFTLIELMVAIAVLGILVTLAAPSFNGFIDKYRAKRAADTVSSFLINTKSEAVKRNRAVSAVLTGGGAAWCMGMTEASTCNCVTQGACLVGGVERVVRGESFKGVSLIGPATGHAFEFKPLRGTVGGNDTVEFVSANGLKVNVVVGTVGRRRVCARDGSITGYPAC